MTKETNLCVATEEDIKESRRKCDYCKRTAHFYTWHGGRYCTKHFIQNAKRGTEEGLWSAIKRVRIINIFKI